LKNTNKRVNDFVLTSLEGNAQLLPPDEYIVQLKKDKNHKVKFLGGDSIVINKDIKPELKKQKFDLDIPQEVGLKLRPQDKTKEIGPPLRYTFRGDMERIYDGLHNKGYPSVQKHISEKGFLKRMKKFKNNFKNHLNNKTTSEKKFLSPK
jgi:hypothetical protein